jgi:hypothetical protein
MNNTAIALSYFELEDGVDCLLHGVNSKHPIDFPRYKEIRISLHDHSKGALYKLEISYRNFSVYLNSKIPNDLPLYVYNKSIDFQWHTLE